MDPITSKTADAIIDSGILKISARCVECGQYSYDIGLCHDCTDGGEVDGE